MDRHRAKVRELIKEVQVRKVKYEQANQEFLTKNQMILKQIFKDELDYIKSLWTGSGPEVEKTADVPIVESEVLMSDDYDRDTSKL